MPLPVGKRERERAGLGLPSRLKKPGGRRRFQPGKKPRPPVHNCKGGGGGLVHKWDFGVFMLRCGNE